MKQPTPPPYCLSCPAAYGPWTEFNPRVWPTVVFDASFPQSEEMETLLARRDWYLSHNTGINIWIGAKHFREAGKWWIGVAHRNFNPPTPPVEQQLPETWPPSIWMFQLPGIDTGEYESLTTPRTEVWEIPTEMVFHPDPIPVYDPQIPHLASESLKNPLPSTLKLDLERFRDTILNPKEQGPMELVYEPAGLDLITNQNLNYGWINFLEE